MNKLFFLIFTLITFLASHAQNSASISGVVLDKNMNNEPLAFATVALKDEARGTITDIDGKFILENISGGSHILVFSFVGYLPEERTIEILSGTNKEISVILEQNSLDEVVITSVAKKESEEVLLTEQREAVQMTTAIGAVEISRKGVSDAATAVSRTAGISRQEDSGNIYVRGLGDRYNITTLNGLPIPSNNPQTKNINLNIFLTDIVENISISKIYIPENYADFSGANINILSKKHSGATFLKVGLGGSTNTNVTGLNAFYLQPGPGGTGFYNQEYASDVLDRYTFDTSDKSRVDGVFNKSFSLSAGKTFFVGGMRLNAFVAATHKNDYNYFSGISRGNVTVQNVIFTDLIRDKYIYNTNTTAIANLNLMISPNHSVQFNSLLINSSQQFHEEYNGNLEIFEKGPGFIRFSGFDRTRLLVNQLLGKSKLSDVFDLKWAVGYNDVKNIIPNRITNTLVYRDSNDFSKGFVPSTRASAENNRFYQNLNEDEWAANLFLNYHFARIKESNEIEDSTYRGKITLGYSSRAKKVNFDAIQFNLAVDKTINPPNIDPNNLDDYFNQSGIDNNLFEIKTFRANKGEALTPQVYDGVLNIHAFFAATEYKLSDKLIIIAGIRGESVEQNISWKTQLSPNGGNNDYDAVQFLPNLSVKYTLNDNQNLKFAASKTYTLPQLKERAPFQFQYVTTVEVGNPDLYASTDYNFDLKWEIFPKRNELLSLTLFGKIIQNPINKVVVASATNDLSFVNTGNQATAMGAELELKKTLWEIDNNQSLRFGFNASYMTTNQDFDNKKVAKETNLSVFFTNTSGSLTGASPLLINADLSYQHDFAKNKNLTATLTYNYFSDRLFAIGIAKKGNQVNQAVGTFDFVLQIALSKRWSLGFSAKNLLNPEVNRIQENNILGDVVLNSYVKGISTGLSLSYIF